MATSLCIGSYNCSSPSRTEEFQRSPTPQNSLSSCRTSMVLEKRNSERLGFSLKGRSTSGVHGYGFLLKVRPCRAFQSGEWGIHVNDSSGSPPHHASCMEEEAFCNACQPCADSCGQNQVIGGIAINRRAAAALLLFTISASLEHAKLAMAADAEVKPPLNLEMYTDEKEGFTVLRPAQWNKIDKAGATVLFEDPQSKSNNVGVVVNPVRISSLNEFGTVDVVVDKLLQAEKRKPSTNDVQLIKVNERQVHGGAPLYLLEYKLDSSRGVKRILSAVTVASRKLYILNVAYADSSEKPLLPDTASVLEKIANSFDVLN